MAFPEKGCEIHWKQENTGGSTAVLVMHDELHMVEDCLGVP
jgi:hypothetical protein